MKTIKVIFLDVDGVLNPGCNIMYNHNNNMSTSSYHIKLYDKALANLKMLVDQTGAKIVISSSWRLGGNDNPAILNLAKQLSEYGLSIYDFTPVLSTRYRGNEIREYIRNSEIPISSFVILDDDSDMCEFTKYHLSLCPFKTGFGTHQMNYAKQVLNINSLSTYYRLRNKI